MNTLATVAQNAARALARQAARPRRQRRRYTVEEIVASVQGPSGLSAAELQASANLAANTREMIKLHLLSRAIDGDAFARLALAAHGA